MECEAQFGRRLLRERVREAKVAGVGHRICLDVKVEGDAVRVGLEDRGVNARSCGWLGRDPPQTRE